MAFLVEPVDLPDAIVMNRPESHDVDDDDVDGEMAMAETATSGRPMTAQTRPTTAMTGANSNTQPFVVPEITQEEEEEDDDAGMFSFLPPANSAVASPVLSNNHTSYSQPTTRHNTHLSPLSSAQGSNSAMVSPAAAYAAAFAHGDPDFAARLIANRNAMSTGNRSTYLDDDPFGTLPSSAVQDGYTVNQSHYTNSRGTPVIELESKLRQAGVKDGERDSQASKKSSIDPESGEILPSSRQQTGDSYMMNLGKYGSSTGGMDQATYLEKLRELETYDGTDPLALLDELAPEEEDSPFPEVRASVSNIDDPEMPCLTFRSWVVGVSLTAICACLNLFFNLRYPSPYISAVLVQIVAYPIGKILAVLLPMWYVPVPGFCQRWFGWDEEWSLNPGPFNIKGLFFSSLQQILSI